MIVHHNYSHSLTRKHSSNFGTNATQIVKKYHAHDPMVTENIRLTWPHITWALLRPLWWINAHHYGGVCFFAVLHEKMFFALLCTFIEIYTLFAKTPPWPLHRQWPSVHRCFIVLVLRALMTPSERQSGSIHLAYTSFNFVPLALLFHALLPDVPHMEVVWKILFHPLTPSLIFNHFCFMLMHSVCVDSAHL